MELTNRERFLRLMHGETVDRAPFFPCFGPWPETLERWHTEGLSPDADYRDVVGFDGDLRHILPVNAYLCPQPEQQVLADEGETQVIINNRGIKQRVRKDGGSMPEFLSHPVETPEDWARVRGLLRPDVPGRLPEAWDSFCQAHADRTEPWYAGDLPVGFFGGPRELMGFEKLVLSYYDEPSFICDVMDTLCDLWVELFPTVLTQAPVDFFFVWEDMCYKTGPLISPATFREFLLPRYKRLTGMLREAGVDIIMVDSDGDPRRLIPEWLDGGVTCLFPWETQMGLDITQVRREYPTLQMIGGVNKHALALGREAIDEDLRKMPFMLESGRYLPAVDHFVPPDVSWDDYRYFCERLRDLIERYPPNPA